MKHLLLLSVVFQGMLIAQIQHTIMSYNLLNYPGNDTTIRNPYFRTTISATLPDILVCQEMTSQEGVNGFLQNVLLPNYSGYAAGVFIDGPDTDNELFYKTDLFTFISNTPIVTNLRNISEFTLIENSSGDTLRIFSVHLKASQGSGNEQQRKDEVDSLRKVTSILPPGSFYLVLGDFNIYSSTEPAYSALLDQLSPGYFIDIYDLPGVWNNPDYAPYHTQSTRTRQFGGGSTGGLDDRFDMILMSPSIIDTSGIHYLDSTYLAYGNDGMHYNDSINQPPNLAVGQVIANALHYSSDHLPVIAGFTFESVIPVEIISFKAVTNNNGIFLSWSTATETNNKGFDIERAADRKQPPEGNKWKKVGYVAGYGTTTEPKSYSYTDKDIPNGTYSYRLKQIDYDGKASYSNIIQASYKNLNDFALYQNYPNPFNPSTKIGFSVPAGLVTLEVFNILGNKIATLINEYKSAGRYEIQFNGKDLPSGMYFYKIRVMPEASQATKSTAVKKMILLK
jgi:hypothetical protein